MTGCRDSTAEQSKMFGVFGRLNIAPQLCIAASIWCLPIFAQEPLMVGSSLDLLEAASLATEACIATLESHGQFGLGASNVSEVIGGRMTASHNLLKDGQPSKTVFFHIMGKLTGEGEQLPKLGVPYLFLGTTLGDRMEVKKVVMPTISNIRAVVQILEQRGLRVEAIGETKLKSLLTSTTISAPRTTSSVADKGRGIPPVSAEKGEVSVNGWNSVLWVFGLLIIIAAIGLLWLMLRRRAK